MSGRYTGERYSAYSGKVAKKIPLVLSQGTVGNDADRYVGTVTEATSSDITIDYPARARLAMYRKRTKGSKKFNEKMARARAAKESKRLAEPPPEYPPDSPLVRRRVVVEDYDAGEVVRHEFVLRRSGRIDCYKVEVDGQVLPGRYGWSRAVELVRKAFVRIVSFA